jgi:hypothetical protein
MRLVWKGAKRCSVWVNGWLRDHLLDGLVR